MTTGELQGWLLLMSLVNVAAMVASVTVAVYAYRTVRGGSTKDKKRSTVDRNRNRNVYLGHETPTEVSTVQRVRRSPLPAAEARRDYFNRPDTR